jgi:hypothetical protein
MVRVGQTLMILGTTSSLLLDRSGSIRGATTRRVSRQKACIGTEHEDHLAGRRVDLDLDLYGIPDLGVLLIYHKYGGGYQEAFTSKGDMNRLKEWVRNLHNDPLPVGLFIPFPKAYEAVKEFIETDGQLPKCIKWVANKDLLPGTFPDP